MQPPQLRKAAELHQHVPPGWYEQSIRDNPLQRFWHRRRFVEVSRVLEPTQGTILDIGSADGVFTNVIAQGTHAPKIIGIDVLQECVDWANSRWKGTVMEFRLGDGHTLDFPDNTFAAVFALEMLEHVFDPVAVLREVRRVLRPGGYAVLLVPSDNLLFRVIWYLWTHLRGKIWADTHIQTFRGGRLSKVAKEAGMTLEVDHTFLLGMLHLVKARKHS